MFADSRQRLVASLAFATLAVACVSPVVPACDETVTIDSTEYPIGDFWCGRRLDSTEIADPGDLVQLPQELTFQEYRIYVLPETRDAFVAMARAAEADSISLRADSGFRSPNFQRRIIRGRLERGDGFETILKSVAPPGYSEHHTGRALDLCPSEAIFAFTDTYTWLKKNAGEYGFYETLPEDPKAPLTWESWHWAYLGVDSNVVKQPSDTADN